MVQKHLLQKIHWHVIEAIEAECAEELHKGIIRGREDRELSFGVGHCVEQSGSHHSLDEDGQVLGSACDIRDGPLLRRLLDGLLCIAASAERKEHGIDHVHDAVASCNVRENDSGIAADALDDHALSEIHHELGAVQRRKHLLQKLDRYGVEAVDTESAEKLKECLIR